MQWFGFIKSTIRFGELGPGRIIHLGQESDWTISERGKAHCANEGTIRALWSSTKGGKNIILSGCCWRERFPAWLFPADIFIKELLKNMNNVKHIVEYGRKWEQRLRNLTKPWRKPKADWFLYDTTVRWIQLCSFISCWRKYKAVANKNLWRAVSTAVRLPLECSASPVSSVWLIYCRLREHTQEESVVQGPPWAQTANTWVLTGCPPKAHPALVSRS